MVMTDGICVWSALTVYGVAGSSLMIGDNMAAKSVTTLDVNDRAEWRAWLAAHGD